MDRDAPYPIHAATLFVNPAYAYSCNFDVDGEVMGGILTCFYRMVLDANAHRAINCKMEMYREANKLFGFADVVNERSVLMPRKPLEFKILIMCFI
jgi:hypothetical protein